MTSCSVLCCTNLHLLFAECTFHAIKHVTEEMLSMMVSNLDIILLSALNKFRTIL